MATWLLGFGLVAYLGLNGGGYDPLVSDQVGIAVWWALLAGALVGVLPRQRLSPLAWLALGLLAAFAAWTALSLSWTESGERTFADLARVVGYLGVFALALFLGGERGVRRMVGAVAAAIVCVSLVALLSRLHPSWFTEADQTAQFLSETRERLSFPIHYWNGLAALIAIGLPLVLHAATCARSTLLRAVAAAALPALALTAFCTLSRGGIAAAIVVLAVFLALTSDRLPKLLTLLVAGGGSAILIAALDQREALQDGLLNSTAQGQADELQLLTLIVCAVVGLLQAGISVLLLRDMRPRWTYVGRNLSRVALVLGLVAALIVAIAIHAPSRVSDGWDEFKGAEAPGGGTERLTRFAGQGRYQLWQAAVDENRTEPLLGTGSGTFDFWWARNGVSGTVRDTHSLYLQTLGELGIVGLAILAMFVLAVLGGGAWLTIRAGPRGSPQLAAALAGCLAFFLTAAFDWMWQIPVLPVAMLLLAAPLIGSGVRSNRGQSPTFSLPPRLMVAVTAAVAIAAIAIPLASTSLLRRSEADFRGGDLAAALDTARTAENVQPSAAAPRLQQALVLEAQGDFGPAADAARGAAERESTNWRPWFVLSRLEARRGFPRPAIRYMRRAESLNPSFSLFDR